ncbi:MAG: hypothetical protein ACK4S0_02105 [Sediminibacterium sp.]|nr:hypothetical protein [uncultured Sediminibacterium sp.]
MKYLICSILFFAPQILNAQTEVPISIFIKDANGRLVDGLGAGYKMEGSPYLLKSFKSASIINSRGKSYANITANINLETNEIIFETPDNKKMAVSIPVSRIIFEDPETNSKQTFLSGFSPIDRLTDRSFYQLLDSGTVLLLKSYQVSFTESRGYSESTPTRVYEQNTAYYLFLPATGLVKVPRSISDVPGLFEKEKKDKLNSFIRTNQLKSRNEADLIKLIAYYNSL